MTMPAFPALGDTSWRDDWAQAVHNAATEVVSGRLAPAALTETAQDAAAAALAAGAHTGISFTYDDANNRISATVSGGGGGFAPCIDAAAHGWSPSATAAANNAAMAEAVEEAVTLRKPLWIGSSGGVHHVNAPVDWTADGLVVWGGGPENTIIQQDDGDATIAILGGEHHEFSGMALRHPDGAYIGHGIELQKLYFSRIANMEINNNKSGIFMTQADILGSGNWMFSCNFDNLRINGYADSGLSLKSYGAMSTGSAWSNIYVQNEPTGTALTASKPPVELFMVEESTFNQLNIEGVKLAADSYNMFLSASGGVVTINGLHFERATLSAGWDQEYVRAYDNSGVIINGLSLALCDVAGTGSNGAHRLLSAGAKGRIKADGISINGGTKTRTAARWTLAEVDTDPGSVVEVGYHGGYNTPIAFNALTDTAANPGMKRIGDQLYALGSAVRAQTKTAAYTLTAGDAGSVIEVNSASAVTITVPSAVLAAGSVVEIVQLGAGTVTIAAGSGMTLRTASSLTTRAQYATVAIRARSTTEAVVSGDLT